MLREIQNTRQVPGEQRRRWFFSHDQDLLVWFGEDGKPVAFQLAYGKYRAERALRWKQATGFAHYEVDAGIDGREQPLLMPDGPFDAPGVLDGFLALSGEVPRDIVEFVSEQLRRHPEYHGS